MTYPARLHPFKNRLAWPAGPCFNGPMRAPDVSASGKTSRFTRLLIGTVLGLILLAAAPGRAAPLVRDDEFLLRNWDTEDGLPSSTASHMARDREGYLWLATWRGLARFDGNHWEVFNRRTTPALKNDILGNIWTDRSGRLLISASSGGLIRPPPPAMPRSAILRRTVPIPCGWPRRGACCACGRKS